MKTREKKERESKGLWFTEWVMFTVWLYVHDEELRSVRKRVRRGTMIKHEPSYFLPQLLNTYKFPG